MTLGFVLITFFTVVLSELVPKALTLQHTLFVARLTVWPVLILRRIAWPLVWLMSVTASLTTQLMGLGPVKIEDAAHTPDEIRQIAREAGEQGVLTTRERSLILNTLTLGRRHAVEIMVPRVDVAFLDITRSMAANRQLIGERLYSRLPVCERDLDHVIGVIHTKEFLTAQEESGTDSSVLLLLAKPPVRVPENIPLDQLLAVFKESGTHLVFLVDEHGGMEGIVTLTDVVDELLGEIREHGEAHPDPGRLAAAAGLEDPAEYGSFVVAGSYPIRSLSERLGRHLDVDDAGVHTLGGLVTSELGHVPRVGEEIDLDGVKLRVLEASDRRVARIEVTPPMADADRLLS